MIDPREVVAVVLAAGLSRRFGAADKLMAPYRGQPLVSHAAQLVLGFPFQDRLAVVRSETRSAETLKSLGLGLRFNSAPEVGIGSSLAIAVRAAEDSGAKACLILLGDMPGVTTWHLGLMLAQFEWPTAAVVSGDGKIRLPPALIGNRHFAAFAGLAGDRGGLGLVPDARVVASGSETLSDVDTLADLAAIEGTGAR